jgi:hypothetical protein
MPKPRTVPRLTHAVTIRLDEHDHIATLERMQNRTGLSQSRLIRDAIEFWALVHDRTVRARWVRAERRAARQARG